MVRIGVFIVFLGILLARVHSQSKYTKFVL